MNDYHHYCQKCDSYLIAEKDLEYYVQNQQEKEVQALQLNYFVRLDLLLFEIKNISIYLISMGNELFKQVGGFSDDTMAHIYGVPLKKAIIGPPE